MQLKHIAFLTLLCTSLYAIGVSAYALYGEPVMTQIDGATLPMFDKSSAVGSALNWHLPIAAICIALLLYTYRINPIGFWGISISIIVLLIGVHFSLDAGALLVAQAGTSLDQIVWWMPKM